MSLSGFNLIRAAYDVPGLDEHERAVLVLLAFMANGSGEAWPSIGYIVEKTGAAERTVQRAIKRLCAAGHLSQRRRRHDSAVYTVRPDPKPVPVTGVPVTGVPVTGVTLTPVTQAPRPVTLTPKLPRTTNSQKTTSSSRDARGAKPVHVSGLSGAVEAGDFCPAEPETVPEPEQYRNRDSIAPGGPEDLAASERVERSTPVPAVPGKPAHVERQDPRGTRLTQDFEIPDDWIAWAIEQRGWTLQAAHDEGATFRDYWLARPGKDGRKSDWPATWRNWVRRSRREARGLGKSGRALQKLNERMKENGQWDS